MEFKRASKKSARLRLALIGISGGGKTYSALALATVLGKRVALVDTEHASASKYAPSRSQPLGTPGIFEFDTLSLERFEPAAYIDAIHLAERAGYDVLILDSLSHAWSGTGGLLDQKDAKSGGGGSSFDVWRTLTPQHNQLVEAMLQCRCHLIVTMRAKTSYEVEKDDRGKVKITKVGLAPVQRDGLEYEFDVVLDLDADHTGRVSKSRCSAVTRRGSFREPGRELAQMLVDWLDGDVVPAPVAAPTAAASRAPTAPAPTPAADPPMEVALFVEAMRLTVHHRADAVTLWLDHRAALAKVDAAARTAAWRALCDRIGAYEGTPQPVGEWLRTELAAEEARRIAAPPREAPVPAETAASVSSDGPLVSGYVREWAERFEGATGKALLSDAEAVGALDGDEGSAVRALYVARWDVLFRGYDDATFLTVLPKLEALPAALTDAPEWASAYAYLEQRVASINAAEPGI